MGTIACTGKAVLQTRLSQGFGLRRCVEPWLIASSSRLPYRSWTPPKRDGLRPTFTTFRGVMVLEELKPHQLKSRNQRTNCVFRGLVTTSASSEASADGSRTKDILSNAEKKELRAMAGRLGKRLCVHQVGRGGLQESGIQALRDALVANELVKVKLGGNCPLEMDEAIEIVENELASDIVGTLGNTFLIYKPNYNIKSKLRAAVQAAREAKQAGRT